MVRRLALLVALAATAVLVPATPVVGDPFPDRIELPDDFRPEGIDIRGSTFYVGSIPTGAVYAGDLRTGDGDVLVPGREGRAAIGVDEAGGQLWVAGGPTGMAFVYDAETGADVDSFQLAATTPTFVNDVVVTGDTAYLTDSQQPVVYRVQDGVVTALGLGGDYEHQVGAFNLNGIDATPDGSTLLAVQSATGKLFLIDPSSGAATLVDLGGATLTNADGILLLGRTLYVVQNRLDQIAVVELVHDLLSGAVVRTISDTENFDVPTTIARHGNRLYAANARFRPAGEQPPTDYWVSSVAR